MDDHPPKAHAIAHSAMEARLHERGTRLAFPRRDPRSQKRDPTACRGRLGHPVVCPVLIVVEDCRKWANDACDSGENLSASLFVASNELLTFCPRTTAPSLSSASI